jgi:hypothetical protein
MDGVACREAGSHECVRVSASVGADVHVCICVSVSACICTCVCVIVGAVGVFGHALVSVCLRVCMHLRVAFGLLVVWHWLRHAPKFSWTLQQIKGSTAL